MMFGRSMRIIFALTTGLAQVTERRTFAPFQRVTLMPRCVLRSLFKDVMRFPHQTCDR